MKYVLVVCLLFQLGCSIEAEVKPSPGTANSIMSAEHVNIPPRDVTNPDLAEVLCEIDKIACKKKLQYSILSFKSGGVLCNGGMAWPSDQQFLEVLQNHLRYYDGGSCWNSKSEAAMHLLAVIQGKPNYEEPVREEEKATEISGPKSCEHLACGGKP